MNNYGIFSSFSKRTFLDALCACIAVVCVSCGGQKQNMEEQGCAIKQDTVTVANEDVPKDTIDIDIALQKIESLVSDLKRIHITKASDTIKYKNLEKRYKNMCQFEREGLSLEEQKHSVRVKYLENCISLWEEILRIDDEIKKVGLKGLFKDKEQSEYQVVVSKSKKRLWRETN